jgi:hypothetical protein
MEKFTPLPYCNSHGYRRSERIGKPSWVAGWTGHWHCCHGNALRVAAQASGLSEYERRVVGIALRERDRVGAMLARPDVVAIADFAKPSHDARLHFVDMVGGSVRSHLVAHGRGSDPAHVGWLKQFSNSVGSLATSRGAYLTAGQYEGQIWRLDAPARAGSGQFQCV